MEIEYLKHFSKNNFFLIAGPCVIENEEITFSIAEYLCEICDKYSIPFIFKASYKKANRSKFNSFTGIGDEKGLSILQKIRESLKTPILTDFHSQSEASLVASYNIDILQIPAFLSRQTDILEAAAKTGRYVNVKKGQFLSPESMEFVVEKLEHFGNDKIILTDRGTQFGYNDLIVDFRGIPIMQSFGHPVVLDVTHSLQKPNQSCGITGGAPQFAPVLSKGAIAIGVDGLFIETHPNPSSAKSDGDNMMALNQIEPLLKSLIRIKKAII